MTFRVVLRQVCNCLHVRTGFGTHPTYTVVSTFPSFYFMIGKHSYLDDGCVVANYSLVNRSFKREGKNLLIGGNPAQVLMTDFAQVKENKLFGGTVEAELAKIYD